jgi:exodeoxyribonuclease VII large subunit
MSDLFDLPFEDEDDDEAVESPPSAASSLTGAAKPLPGDRPTAPTDDPPPSGDRRPPAVDTRRIVHTVTELTVRLRDHLEAEFFEVWVEGELSNCRLWNGHLYFTLKDESAQLRGFMFRSTLRYLKFKPADGLRVVARGRLSVYEPKGEYQLVTEHLEPQGLGALQLAFDQLKKRLQEEGLFDAARKRPLPALPRKIGVVTSLDGAAIRDILNVLKRRHANAHVIIRPARVQGEGAAGEIAIGLRAIARVPGVDVVIVGRGGGSIEDLWAFNTEIVARAIAAVKVPVVSAVGHESDVTIADFVADLRAPTPSAAAEMVVARTDEFAGRIDRLHERLVAAAHGRVQRLSRRVHVAAGRPAMAGYPARLAMKGRHAAELDRELEDAIRLVLATRARRLHTVRRQLDVLDLGRRLAAIRVRLVAARSRLTSAAARRQHQADAQLRTCASRLETLSPLAVLARGYAVCWNADRTRALRDAAEVRDGDTIRVTLSRGEIDAKVSGTE